METYPPHRFREGNLSSAGLGKETYPEDRFNGISVHLACSLTRDFTKGLLNQV